MIKNRMRPIHPGEVLRELAREYIRLMEKVAEEK